MRIDKKYLILSLVALMALCGLTACDDQKKAAEPYLARVSVEEAKFENDVTRASGAGEIKARIASDLSFKISGRVIERHANVGDHVKAGQVLARLDPAEQQADLDSAKAAVASQEATLMMTNAALSRREALTRTGAMSQQELDSALQAQKSAEKDLDAAKAKLGSSIEALKQTELLADADGTITARNVEVGQVVQSSTSVFTLAHDGERDAVFNVQESVISSNKQPLSLEVALLSRPNIKASASVREISPALNRSLGTVQVKLAIPNPPPEMTLGSAIVANVLLDQQQRISIPWQSVFSSIGKPAVWLVDPQTKTTHMKLVSVERYDASRVVLSGGLKPGDLVVVEGNQFLRDHQQVSYFVEAKQ